MVVWPELSAPTSSINIIIITANYMYVLYVVTIIKHYFIYTVYLYRYMYLKKPPGHFPLSAAHNDRYLEILK